MPLAMSRPWKHPNSGVYWLRKGVPDDLRALVGKREEKRSLGTRDPVEAKRRHAEALAEIEERWANLRSGPKILTEKAAHQLAMVVHDWWLHQHTDNPSQQAAWNVDLADRVFAPRAASKSYDYLYDVNQIEIDPDRFRRSCPPAWCSWRWGTAFSGESRAGQLAIAGRLTVGLSLNGAMVSSVM